MELSGQMILFARVVQEGSFSAAARQLDHTPSAISRQIGLLEDQLGVRLLTRSGRGITMTDEGRRFYQNCQTVAHEVSQAHRLIEEFSDHAKGVLKVVSTTAFGKSQVLPILADFIAQNPDVSVSLRLTDGPIDLSSGEADVAIRFSEQVGGQSSISRKLADNKRILVAAPSYLDKHGVPQTLQDLRGHNCLKLSTVSDWNDWIPPGAKVPFDANSADGVYHAAKAGLGVARLSTYLVNADLADGSLRRVLPDYTQESSRIMLLFADKRNLSPKVRVFIDFMADLFGSTPPWERAGDTGPAVE